MFQLECWVPVTARLEVTALLEYSEEPRMWGEILEFNEQDDDDISILISEKA
jgi:hypothetical protein